VPPPDWWPRDDPGLCQIYGVPPLTLGIGSMAHEQLYWSCAAPWPEERLGEIGGQGAAYIQDYLEKREEGEKRKRQVLDLFGDWNPQVRNLVEGTDPLTITQHAQFYRLPEDCKVRGAVFSRPPISCQAVLRPGMQGRSTLENPRRCARCCTVCHFNLPTCALQVWGRGRVTLLGDAAHLATPGKPLLLRSRWQCLLSSTCCMPQHTYECSAPLHAS
jgi:hypothetical protein